VLGTATIIKENAEQILQENGLLQRVVPLAPSPWLPIRVVTRPRSAIFAAVVLFPS
jgi:hypothetical protein